MSNEPSKSNSGIRAYQEEQAPRNFKANRRGVQLPYGHTSTR